MKRRLYEYQPVSFAVALTETSKERAATHSLVTFMHVLLELVTKIY